MFPLIPADLLRLLGLVLVPLAGSVAGWPSAAVMALVVGTQWLLRWLTGGSALDWAAQVVLLLAGWFSVVSLYRRIEWLDLVTHASASAVIAGLVGLAVRAWLGRRGTDAADLARQAGPTLAVVALTAGALSLGVVWEIAEWWGHHVVTEEIGVGYDDTLGDLTADLLGGLVGSLAAVRAVLRPSGSHAGRPSPPGDRRP